MLEVSENILSGSIPTDIGLASSLRECSQWNKAPQNHALHVWLVLVLILWSLCRPQLILDFLLTCSLGVFPPSSGGCRLLVCTNLPWVWIYSLSYTKLLTCCWTCLSDQLSVDQNHLVGTIPSEIGLLKDLGRFLLDILALLVSLNVSNAWYRHVNTSVLWSPWQHDIRYYPIRDWLAS